MFSRSHRFPGPLPDLITPKHIAKWANKTPAAIYKMIQESRGVGAYFTHAPRIGYHIERGYFLKLVRWPVKDWTKHPDLFDCYWGAWNALAFASADEFIQVVANRNRMAREFKLKNKSLLTIKFNLDHREIYTLEKSRDRLLLFSPYHGNDDHLKYNIKNIREIDPVYNLSAKSFVFYYSENKELFQ